MQGSAESVPLADGDATVVWALSSVHHWSDRAAGSPRRCGCSCPAAGSSRGAAEGARAGGRRTHGLTEPEIDALEADVGRAGFAAVDRETHPVGRKVLAVVRASKA